MTRRTSPLSTPSEGSKAPAPRGWVSFVGSGPGDPGLLTVRAVELLREAEVVVTEVPGHTELMRTVLGDGPFRGENGPLIVDGGFASTTI